MLFRSNPEKEKKEYHTKLYKLIMSGEREKIGDNTIKYFAMYSSGQIPKAALMSHLRQAKIARTEKPVPKDPNIKEFDIMYNADDDDYTELHEIVEAKTRDEAVEIFTKQNPSAVVLSVRPVGADKSPPNPKSGEYIVRIKETPTSQENNISVQADSPEDAQARIRRAYGPNTIIISTRLT